MAELGGRSTECAIHDAKQKRGVIVMDGFDPRYIDLALALIGVEGLALLAWRAKTGSGPAPRPLIANLAAGGSLLLVARALLTGAGAGLTLAALTLALVAHISDLVARWERAPRARERGPPQT
jgi:hypothetical protein